jgi:transglutaminase-like putative cysteine protease/tetratricopeptide (TPR) repeat protein
VSFWKSAFPLAQSLLLSALFLMPKAPGAAADPWDSPAFSASPEALRLAAATIKAGKDAEATMFLNSLNFTFDAQGREVESWHRIYRIENEEGVKNWSEISGSWEPWHQSKPEIKARVVTADGTVHPLDPKTLNDVPVHEDEPDLYSDARRYGGPLPAIAAGAIVEEEITIRDTSVFFAGGMVERRALVKDIPVTKTRVVISHPESLPLRYVLQLLPSAKVSKATENGIETITMENGPLEAFTEDTRFLPPDVLPYPELEFSTGSSWQNVAAEYARLVHDKLRLTDVQSLVAKAGGKDAGRLDVVRRLVGALHKSVRYTGVEFGESSLAPQYPAETLKRKYGDCKDKATLLVAMLRAAGIPANLALLSSGPGPDINIELPGMGMFDHAIVYVPAAGSEADLWIDATAQYSRVGVLPQMDYGRWALVVDEKTTSLKKIPELVSTGNLHRETREFTLAEYGPARIVETNWQEGPVEADYRDFYTGDAKKLREDSEKYVKSAYLADSLISLEKGEASDLDKPFTVTFTAKGRRGFSSRENAVVYIDPSNLMEGLPDYFETSEEERKEQQASDDEDNQGSDPAKPRKFDWQFYPFVHEWHYKITAPQGFKLRALPPNKEEQMGSAHYSQTFTGNAAGTVAEAVLRFDSGKSRLTVEEGKKLRDAIVKARDADAIVITFDQVGYALLNQGKVRESLAAYQELSALHPKEALHKIQLAYAYLNAGLGDKARALAKQATVLEPNSADAFSTLGWIMEHDLIARRFGRGFDYQAAVEAYRKARELDPKETDPRNKGTQADYAMLLEYDAEGDRYSEKSHMEQAITEFRDLKKRDEEMGKKYDDFVLYDLWYLHRFKELQETVATLPATDVRRGLVLASIAAEQGIDAAIQKSVQITTDEQARSKSVTNAAWMLVRLRKYPEAAQMFSLASRNQGNSGQLASFVNGLKNTKPFEQIKNDPSEPTSVVRSMLFATISQGASFEKITAFLSRNALKSIDPAAEKLKYRQVMFALKKTADQGGVTVVTLGDVAISNARFSVEGNDASGYSITMEALGAQVQHVYVVREDGQYKILHFSSSASEVPGEIGWEVLARLEQNDLAGARKWLDRARERVHISEADDPLSGQPFPHFWTKGQEGDANAIRTAALILLPSKLLKGDYLTSLVRIRDASRVEADVTRLNLVLAHAYAAQERWAELLPVAEVLMKSAPDSLKAFGFAVQAYTGLKRWDDWQKLVEARLQKNADEVEYTRSAAQLARYRGDFAGAQKLIKPLMDRGKATDSDLNWYAWDALLLPDPISPDAIDAAERANDRTKNSNFGILHTLACLYAQSGKSAQARALLLKAMDAVPMEEPDSEIWFGFGKLAEQYGELQAAQAIYARVEKPATDGPGSSYSMAQQRLLVLRNASVTSAKNAGK